jgi:uncharacterized protein YfdQ (DUF2303 family)
MDDIKEIAGQLQEPVIYDSKELLKTPGSTPVGLLPPGWTWTDLSFLMPAPDRIRQTTVVHDVSSFAQYLGEFQGGVGPRIFADDTKAEITAVLDPTVENVPSHQSHVLKLKLSLAPEWLLWKAFCGEYRSKKDFTRFIENNLDQVTGDFSGAKILEMCRDLKATTTKNLEVKEDPGEGNRSLKFSGDVSARGGPAKVAFPEIISVLLRVYKGDTAFQFSARLRWDIEREEMIFAVDLRDDAIVEEDAFGQIVDSVAKHTGISVLRGHYSL